MPIRKTVKRKRVARRPRRAKRSRNTRTVAIQRTPGIADATKVKLKYTEVITLTTNASTIPTYNLFSANSLYDPNYTGAGHQPLGFDEWMGTSATTGFYNQYIVFGMSYRVTFVNTSATYTAQVAVVKKPNEVVSTNMNTVAEKAYSQTRLLSTSTASFSRCVVKGYVPCAKIAGLTAEQWRVEDNYRGSWGSNPTLRIPMLHIYACNPDSISTTVKVQVDLMFYATLCDRVPMAGS